MSLLRDWPYLLGLGAFGGAVLAVGAYAKKASDAGRPADPQLVPRASAPPRGQLTGESVVTAPGRTYFVALETNGSVDAAATPERIAAFAQNRGFSDVAVFEGEPPPAWPVAGVAADYFVRGTFAGAVPQSFARDVSVFLGSAKLLDAWEV